MAQIILMLCWPCLEQMKHDDPLTGTTPSPLTGMYVCYHCVTEYALEDGCCPIRETWLDYEWRPRVPLGVHTHIENSPIILLNYIRITCPSKKTIFIKSRAARGYVGCAIRDNILSLVLCKCVRVFVFVKHANSVLIYCPSLNVLLLVRLGHG